MIVELIKQKTICLIPKNELVNYKLLGVGSGISMEHCMLLGRKHCENFDERVCGYTIGKDKTAEMLEKALADFGLLHGEKYMSISFYEKNLD